MDRKNTENLELSESVNVTKYTHTRYKNNHNAYTLHYTIHTKQYKNLYKTYFVLNNTKRKNLLYSTHTTCIKQSKKKIPKVSNNNYYKNGFKLKTIDHAKLKGI